MSFGQVNYDPIRNSYLCELCRKWYPGLSYHVKQVHGVSISQYKEQFGLEKKKSLIIKDIARAKRDNVIRTGMYKNLTMAGWLKTTKGKTTIQRYKRSAETTNRIKDLHSFRKSEQRIKQKRKIA